MIRTVGVANKTGCPPHHVTYWSDYLATNAAILHTFKNPHCEEIVKLMCHGHWHIGHSSHTIGHRCKEGSKDVPDFRQTKVEQRLAAVQPKKKVPVKVDSDVEDLQSSGRELGSGFYTDGCCEEEAE